MKKAVAITCLMLSAATPLVAQEVDQIFNPEITDLSNGSDNPFASLNEDFLNGRKIEAIFEATEQSFRFDVHVGEVAEKTFRIVNVGEAPGDIGKPQLLSGHDVFQVHSECASALRPEEFCEITISAKTGQVGTVGTGLVVPVEESDRNSLRFDVSITASEKEVKVISLPEDEVLRRRQFEVASSYFGYGGKAPGYSGYVRKGFNQISAERPQPAADLGVPNALVRSDVVTSQEGFGENVRTVKSSLPVDTSKILTTDRVIKAVLETPISNILCGKVVALVESDVYGSSGSKPLIKSGSRVIGSCGQFTGARAAVSWHRIITTDGRSIEIDAGLTEARDVNGLGGIPGRRYRSPMDHYVLPALSTAIGIIPGVAMAVLGENEQSISQNGDVVATTTSATNEGIRLVGQTSAQEAQQIISKIIDPSEVVVIPTGSRIDIEIGEDIVFVDEKRVVRVADMEYEVEAAPTAVAEVRENPRMVLTPYRKGLKGPVVELGGQIFVLSPAERSTISGPRADVPTLPTEPQE